MAPECRGRGAPLPWNNFNDPLLNGGVFVIVWSERHENFPRGNLKLGLLGRNQVNRFTQGTHVHRGHTFTGTTLTGDTRSQGQTFLEDKQHKLYPDLTSTVNNL